MKKPILALLFSLLLNFSAASAGEVLRLSTTTSTENSGLLAVLNPPFEKTNGIKIDIIAVGSGKALKLGENGDVDVMFVHAPEAEEKLVAGGFGVDRVAVMHNDFVIAGPKADPAGIKASVGIEEAMKKISTGSAAFISRGDDSGTHKKELEVWKKAGISPQGDWYVSAGQGMGAVLRMADDKLAYTLTDRGTFLSYKDKTELIVLFEGDKTLLNPYHLIAVNPARHVHVNYELAKKYIQYVTGPEGQSIIAQFKKDGQQLFYPDALK